MPSSQRWQVLFVDDDAESSDEEDGVVLVADVVDEEDDFECFLSSPLCLSFFFPLSRPAALTPET